MGTKTAWQREMLQFWALLLSNGRRLRPPQYLFTPNADTGKMQPRTVGQVAALLARRIEGEADHIAPGVVRSIEAWLADSLIVPGERTKGLIGLPAAGLSVPHFLGVGLFNKPRERYWAVTFYLWLASDLEYSRAVGRPGVGQALRDYMSDGLVLDEVNDGTDGRPLTWTIDNERLSKKDPEILLAAAALSSRLDDGLPSLGGGLPREFFSLARPVLDTDRAKFTILCPGSVVLMRRSIGLLLESADQIGHGAVSHLIETALAHSAAQYYVRGMRVLNDYVRDRSLPDDCAKCIARFGPDVTPVPLERDRHARWIAGDYHGSASAEEASFVEANCEAPSGMFLNAGTKEDESAKDMARLSLESLRQQLSLYTVNRLWISIAWTIAEELTESVPGLKRPETVFDVLPFLDSVYENDAAVLLATSRWKERLRHLVTDRDVPGPVVDEVLDQVADNRLGPRELEEVARNLIAESVLSARYFGRYVEVLNSILGGGALPSNQDPKGMMARGGRAKSRFHLAINDSLLELLVAITTLEAEQEGRPLSFSQFLEKLSERYLLNIDRVPPQLPAGSGLAAQAISESREALRARLSAMGFLKEFSDSSNWNRLRWLRR